MKEMPASSFLRRPEVSLPADASGLAARALLGWMDPLLVSGIACAVLLLCSAPITLRAQTVTTLASFDGTDGVQPASRLVQATDGDFYGTTVGGGANNNGTVFKITPGGALTALYNF